MTIEINPSEWGVCNLHFDLGATFYNRTVGHSELKSSRCCANSIVFDLNPQERVDGRRSLPWFTVCAALQNTSDI